MKKLQSLAVLIGLIVSVTSVGCYAAKDKAPQKEAADKNLKVVILRHGEKPVTGDNLSCQGEQRALQLASVLNQKFNKPDFNYVPNLNQGKSTTHARMFQTITPFAVKYNLTVNTKLDEKDYSGIAKEVLSKTGTVLMVWEHSGIPSIAKKLGVKDAPEWPDNDFDSIWVITYPKGKATLTKDREGINPATECDY